MNLYFRFFWTIVRALRGGTLEPLDLSRIRLRVWPNDLDLNIHMNNGRYLTLMDIGRVDLMIRSGLAGVIRKNKWYPVVGAQAISFYRPLPPFRVFELTTRISGWDNDWFYLEQEFYLDDKIAARGIVKAMFLGPEGKVASERLVAATGYNGPPLELAKDIDLLAEFDHHERRQVTKAKRLNDLAA